MFKIKILASLVSPEASVLGLQSVGPHMAFPVCVCALLVSLTTVLFYVGPTRMTSFNLNYRHKGPISNYSHIEGEDFNLWILGG